MLNNLLLLNAIGPAVDVGSNVINGVGDLINGENLGENFSEILTQGLEGQDLELLQGQVQNALGNVNGENIAALPEKITTLDEETLKTIEKLLSNKPILDDVNTVADANLSVEEVIEDTQELLKSVGLSNTSNGSANIASVDNLAKDTSGIAASTNASKLINKNLGVVEDGRPLGKDNLQGLVNTADKDASDKNLEILGKSDSGDSNFKEGLLSDRQQAQLGSDLGSGTKIGANASEAKLQDFDFNLSAKNSQDISSLKSEAAAVTKTYTPKIIADDTGYKIVNIVKTESGLELKLHPESLGKLQVKIDVTPEGKTSLVVIADKAETLDLLQRDSKGLEKILQENGLKTDSGSLSFNLNDGGDGWKKFQDIQNNERQVAFNLEQLLNDDQIVPTDSVSHAGYGSYVDNGMLDIVV